MPILIIYGVETLSAESKANFARDQLGLCKRIGEVMQVAPSHVTIFTPNNIVVPLRTEIVVWVEGIFKKPGRTREIRQILAETIRDWFVGILPISCNEFPFIEVFVREFDQDTSGYAHYQRTM